MRILKTIQCFRLITLWQNISDFERWITWTCNDGQLGLVMRKSCLRKRFGQHIYNLIPGGNVFNEAHGSTPCLLQNETLFLDASIGNGKWDWM